MRLCGMACSDSDAAQYVLSLRHRLQVSGVHARWVPTEMIKLHPFGDGANEEFIDDAMCVSTATIERDASIALFVEPGLPFPAPQSRCDLLVKAFYQ